MQTFLRAGFLFYNMQDFNVKEFEQIGVYSIRNLVNGNMYIGSTTMSFNKRLNHHRAMLRGSRHKNNYLQNAWNYYGEVSFAFEILEIVEKCRTFEVEQRYLDELKPKYNINPLASGTPSMSQYVIDKRSKTFKKSINDAMDWYRKIKTKEACINDVPNKLRKLVLSRLNNVVWNKGKTKEDVDYSFLKGVPKTITGKVLEAIKLISEKAREKYPNIFVFDGDGNFLKEFRSAPDIEEWSKTEENNFPIKSRFKSSRMGVPIKHLLSICIIKAVNKKTSYKGLFFLTDKNSIQEIIEKLTSC